MVCWLVGQESIKIISKAMQYGSCEHQQRLKIFLFLSLFAQVSSLEASMVRWLVELGAIDIDQRTCLYLFPDCSGVFPRGIRGALAGGAGSHQ